MNVLHGTKFFIFIAASLFTFAATSLWIITTKLSTRSIATNKEVVSRVHFDQLATTFHLDDVPKIAVISSYETQLNSFWKDSRTSISTQPTPLSFNFSVQRNKSAKIEVLGSAASYNIGYSKAPIENIPGQTLKPDTPSNNSAIVISDCKVPPRGGFKSWSRGVVTKSTPDIHANCTLLFRGNKLEIERIENISYLWPQARTLNFSKWVKELNCTHLRDELENNFYTAKDEVQFLLAFAFVVHNSPFQIFRLLKAIYRSHNIYCIHYDVRVMNDMKQLFNKLATCFDNIIIPSNIIEVYWGHNSLMEAQMNCFKDLLKNHNRYPWRYVITLSGKELPLRTNREIVHLLKSIEGTSAVRAFPVPQSEYKRFNTTWIKDENKFDKYVPTHKETGPIPYNLTIYKSMVYFALTPEFVDYVLNDVVAITLAKFLKGAFIPEEHFYSTLFMIPGVPGGYNASVSSRIPIVSEYIWVTGQRRMQADRYCKSGYIIHNICIITSADLSSVRSKVNVSKLRGPMFHNKYFMERDHTVMDCLEEQLVIRNRLEYKKDCLV